MSGDHARVSFLPRVGVRWLVAVACAVVLVDVGAGVPTIVANRHTDRARAAVTAGIAYAQNTGGLMQDVLAAESASRGYLLTGDTSYLASVPTVVKSGTKLLASIKQGSRSDPQLDRDYLRLVPLIKARAADLAATVKLFHAGKKAASLALVRTNNGEQLTQQLESLAAAMIKRSGMLVDRERTRSHKDLVLSSRAGLGAYAASGVLLILMMLLIRTYLLTDSARRASHTAQLEAERLAAAKSGFLSRVSHELRTPLNAILGFGQLLERGELDAGERETLDQMLTGGHHLLAIVDDLLDLSRVDAGELRLSIEPVQVADVLREARAMLSGAAVTAAIGVRSRAVDPELYVRADRQRLMQVLLNLLSNAVKYSGRGSNVVVSAIRTEADYARIEVADSGIGISEANLELLFAPFERLDAATRGIEGTGLGLAVAKGLVESMGGKLEIISNVGLGTTVAVELQLTSEAAAELKSDRLPQPGEPAPAATAGAAQARPDGSLPVLYIDDNPSNVRLVEKIFSLRSELRLSVARDGASGLALAREQLPGVILLDLHLPDMSGEQVLAALLGDRETAKIPVIIVSADASPTRAKRLKAAGAAGYLTKPFDVDRLIEAVTTGKAGPALAEDGAVADQLLDRPMVNSLRTLAANPAVGPAQIAEMLTTFREDADTMLAAVHTALAAGELDPVQREAHRLVGAAGAYGASRFCHVCRELEHHARAGRLAEARALEGGLDELLEQTWGALQAEFADELRTLISQ